MHSFWCLMSALLIHWYSSEWKHCLALSTISFLRAIFFPTCNLAHFFLRAVAKKGAGMWEKWMRVYHTVQGSSSLPRQLALSSSWPTWLPRKPLFGEICFVLPQCLFGQIHFISRIFWTPVINWSETKQNKTKTFFRGSTAWSPSPPMCLGPAGNALHCSLVNRCLCLSEEKKSGLLSTVDPPRKQWVRVLVGVCFFFSCLFWSAFFLFYFFLLAIFHAFMFF